MIGRRFKLSCVRREDGQLRDNIEINYWLWLRHEVGNIEKLNGQMPVRKVKLLITVEPMRGTAKKNK